jgi:tripartite-type tricarboxylate transporter receptor subunit TctC
LDVAARVFGERLAERWKQPVVIENRPGADGLIGTSAFVGLRDDHVLLFYFAAPISVFPVLNDRLPYDPERDLVPIARATENFVVVSATQHLKVRSLREFVTTARSQPGKLNYNAGVGAVPYIFRGFLRNSGLDLINVFYRDAVLAVQDLAEGRLHIVISTMTALLPAVQGQKVQLLAVTNKRRSPMAQDVPTAVEAGYSDLVFEGPAGFYGWRNMPNELRDRISSHVRDVATDPAVADRLAAVGQAAYGSTPAEFAAAINEQREKMVSLVKLLGILPAR